MKRWGIDEIAFSNTSGVSLLPTDPAISIATPPNRRSRLRRKKWIQSALIQRRCASSGLKPSVSACWLTSASVAITLPSRLDRLQARHQLVVDEGVRRPALTQVRGLLGLGVADRRRARPARGLLDGRRRLPNHVVGEVCVDARRQLVDAGDPDRVRGRLVVVGADVDPVEVDTVGRDLLADPLEVDVERPLVVEHLHRDRSPAVRDDHRSGADAVGDVVVEARRVGAAAEQVPVPAPVAVAVDELVAEVVVARGLLVLVGLLEREVAGPVEGPGRVAVGRIVRQRSRARRGEADGGRADLERRGALPARRCRAPMRSDRRPRTPRMSPSSRATSRFAWRQA